MNTLHLFQKFMLVETFCPQKRKQTSIQNFPLFQILSAHCSMTLAADMQRTCDKKWPKHHMFIPFIHLWLRCNFGHLFIREEKERETEKALVWQNRHSHSIIQSGHPITSLFCPIYVCVCVCVCAPPFHVCLACSMQRFCCLEKVVVVPLKYHFNYRV